MPTPEPTNCGQEDGITWLGNGCTHCSPWKRICQAQERGEEKVRRLKLLLIQALVVSSVPWDPVGVCRDSLLIPARLKAPSSRKSPLIYFTCLEECSAQCNPYNESLLVIWLVFHSWLKSECSASPNRSRAPWTWLTNTLLFYHYYRVSRLGPASVQRVNPCKMANFQRPDPLFWASVWPIDVSWKRQE